MKRLLSSAFFALAFLFSFNSNIYAATIQDSSSINQTDVSYTQPYTTRAISVYNGGQIGLYLKAVEGYVFYKVIRDDGKDVTGQFKTAKYNDFYGKYQLLYFENPINERINQNSGTTHKYYLWVQCQSVTCSVSGTISSWY